jgi:hypothetical protein
VEEEPSNLEVKERCVVEVNPYSILILYDYR